MRSRDLLPLRPLRRLAAGLLVGLAAAGALAGSATASPAACTDTWTGAGNTLLWSDASNWSAQAAPGADDIACIGEGDTVELDAGAPSFTVAGLELDGATLTTDGEETLTVQSELDLQNGGDPDALGAGLTLQSQGEATVDPGLDVCLAPDDTLSSTGTLTLSDGSDLGGAGTSNCNGLSGGSVTSTGTITSQGTASGATIDSLTAATGSTLAGPGILTVGSSLAFPAGAGGPVDLATQLTLDDNAPTTVGANVQICDAPSTTLTIGQTATVALAVSSNLGDNNDPTQVCDGGTGGGQIINQGAITAGGTGAAVNIAPAFFDNDGSVTVGAGSTLAIPASSSDGGGDTGTYDISSGGTLDFSGTERDIAFGGQTGTTFSGTGSLEVTAGTTDFLTDANLTSLGHLVVGPGATAEVDSSLETPTFTTITGDLDGYGLVTVGHGSSLAFSTSQSELGESVYLTNDGTVSVGSGAKVCIDADAALENAGTLTLGSSSALGENPTNENCGPGVLLNDSTGTINSGGGAVIDTATFDNAGSVNVTAGSLILDASNENTDTGGYAIAAGATLSVQGGASRVLAGGLSGAGKLQLSNSGGSGTTLELAPSASGSIGSLNVGAGTTLQLDADATTPPLGSHVPLDVTGTATLNGTIAFDGDSLSDPTSDETLQLLDYGAKAGNPFATPPDDNGWSASVPAGSGAGVITALITPPPPNDVSPPTISGTPVVGHTVTLTQGSWSGNPTRVTDQWEDCDPISGSCVAITGATGPTYAPSDNDIGEQLEVIETASNASGSTSVDSAMTSAVTSLAPLNIAAPDINGDEGIVGETLTEVPGEWANSPAVSLQWEDCDVTGTICTPIPGATGPTYTTTENDNNETIVVLETATNAYGSAQASSEPTSPLLDLGNDGGPAGGGDGGTTGGGGSGGSSHRGTVAVSLPAHAVAGTGVAISLRCPGGGSCPVTLTLRASEPTPAAGRARSKRAPRSRMVVVGSETVTVGSGTHRTVTMSLNRTGTKLLASDHTLRTVLTATSRSVTLSSARVTFTLARTAPVHRARTHRTSPHRGRTHRTTKTPSKTTSTHRTATRTTRPRHGATHAAGHHPG